MAATKALTNFTYSATFILMLVTASFSSTPSTHLVSPSPSRPSMEKNETKNNANEEQEKITFESSSLKNAGLLTRLSTSNTDFSHDAKTYEQVANLLFAVSSTLRECALAITSDTLYISSVDKLFKNNPGSSRAPVTLFTLPETKNDIKKKSYSYVGRETCTHYVFLVHDAGSLLRLLEEIYAEDLNLLAKFVLVTNLERSDVNNFLRSSPISKIVNILLVTPSATLDEVELHLYTHDFFVNNEKISSKLLGVWNKDSAAENRTFEWFPNKLNNFHGFKFRATTFNHPPVSIFEPLPGGKFKYDGLEVRLLMTLASALNFTVDIEMPADGEKWGAKLPDGSWSGAVGETVRGETDVSFANYFITADRLKIMDMTRPYYIDYTCFITPMPKPLPQYTAVAWPLQTLVWISLAIAVLILPLVMRLASIVEPRGWFSSLYNSYWYMVGIFTTSSQPAELVPTTWGLRLVILTSWIAATVISAAYRSSVIAFLLVPLPAQPVNSLEQLLKSGLRWGVRDRGGWDEWFSNSLDPTSQKIAEGFEYVNGIDAGIARVLEGDFAFMNSGTFLRYLIASNFTNEYGQTQLRVAKECFVPFRIGLGMPRFSVYTQRFNDVVGRVVEAGMVSRWFQDLLSKAVQKQRKTGRENSENVEEEASSSTPKKTLGLYHLQGTFALLGLGWLLASVACFIEVLLFHICARGSRLTQKDRKKFLLEKE